MSFFALFLLLFTPFLSFLFLSFFNKKIQRGLDTIDANLALGLPEEMRQYDQVSHILQHIFSQSRLSNVETDKSFVNGSYESPLEAEENESASTESTEESEELPKFLLMTNNPYKIECLSSLGLEV